jgi:hypothetical protein
MSSEPASDSAYSIENIQVLPMPVTFFELLASIRQRPGMYIGRQSLQGLEAWLMGYHFARLQAELPPLPDEAEFDGFDEFVCDRYHWHDVGGWAAHIAYHHRDDHNAFHEFFQLLDEFRAGLPLRQDSSPAK